MTQASPFLYPYTVKRSSRARYVRFVVSAKGLVVVVPERFCVNRDLPPLLEEKKDWIARALEKIAASARLRRNIPKMPETVELRAIGEQWRVSFAPLNRDRLSAQNGILTLTSDFSAEEALFALKRWIHLKGQEHLPPLLDELARRHRFAYAKVTIKEQKSRWGSCSLKGNINLNSRLLFLPSKLTQHILLHELCHLKEMNHSKAFHNLLLHLDPDAAKNKAELKQAWHFVPGWAL
ncbi:MAG: M48 family metallopeptidase [Synergistaceae bacterium]|jgi:predicted metal-dependent hydrolase|nr:M48 family metallopeptidase [Synergistaceae bacterium]